MGIDPFTAIAGSALVGGVTSFLGNQDAAQAAQEAAAVQAQIRAQNTANLQPYMTAGNNALGTYMNAIGLNGAGAQSGYYSGVGNVNNNPGYTGELNAGNTAIMKNAAALGLSGPQANTMYNIGNYGGNLANTFQQQQLSEIGGVAQQGQSAAATLAGTSTLSGALQAQNMTQAGVSQGAGVNGLGVAANTGMQNYLNYSGYMAGLQAKYGGNNLSSSQVQNGASPVIYGNTPSVP